MASSMGCSVLHVDDDVAFGDLTADMLSEQQTQFTVETATSASEGLDRLAVDSFDCIVSDYEMPGQNGIEFLEAVREEYPDLPFILYTGKGSEAVASDAIAAGVTDYLQKESGTSQYTVLANRIRNAVENRRQQERTQATRDRLRQIIDELPQLVFVKDETGEFLLANEATANAYGTTVSNLEGATDADFANSAVEINQFHADDQAVIESGEPKHIPEESLTAADGETRLLKTTKIPYDPVETDGDAVLSISMDITERKEHQQELRQTNTVLRTIVGNLPMGVLVEDTERNILMANDSLGETLGMPVDGNELIGRDCATAAEEFKHLLADPEGFTEGITERLKQRKPIQNEELPLADGRVVERDYVPYTLSEGEAHLWLYRDATERKQRKQELERNRQFLRDTQEVAHIGGWRFNLQSESLRWSDEVYRIHGLALDVDVTTEDAIESYHPDDRDTIREAIDQLTTEGEPFDLELRIVTADGDIRWVRVLGEPVYGDDEIIAAQGTFQDITEHKERERELRMVRKRFKQFAGNVKDAFFLLPTDYSETEYVNPAVEPIYGITPEEAYNDPTSWLRHVHPDDKDELLADMEAQQDGTTEWPIEQEFRIDHPDRGVRWVQARLDMITGENSDSSWVAGVTTDITDLKEHERELERKQGLLEQTQTVASVGGWEMDLRTDSLRWTREVYRIHDVGTDFEPTVEDAIEFYHPEDQTTIQNAVERVTVEGESYDLELRIVTADDEVRWIRTRGEPWYEDGEIVGIRGTFQNITEQIEREQQLEQKTEELEQLVTKYELQYQTLFEEAPVMTVLTRSEDGRPIIEDCNSQFIETLGYDSDTIIGSELAEFYTPESAERLQSEGYSQSLKGQFTREKRELMTIDGEVIEGLLRAVPRRTADGEVIGTVAMYVDITERESVKRANEQLEEFAGIVSHDLRNPLNVAAGRLELVAEECDSAHLDDVEQALDRMGTLIDDLLSLAREGKEVTDAQSVNLATIINECWETVKTDQAVLITNTDRSVRADGSRLKQVFENLFRNAVEHGRADVTVTVGELDDGFYIEDDGPGIPCDERDDIFEAGYSSSDGTGFGLSIVEQIVTAHDWQIRVTDGVDGGARFEITDVKFAAR